MKVRYLAFGTVLVTLAATLTAQDRKGSPPDPKAMMEAMAKAAEPGEHHKVLTNLAGKWTYTGWWAMGPAEKTPLKGTSERTVLMGGRFVHDLAKGNDDTPLGKFEGQGWTGYDNGKKKYIYSWIDNMGTGIQTAEGDYDAKTKTLTFRHDTFNPMFNTNMKGRDVTKITSNDEFTTRFYTTFNGQEMQTMELTYKRVK